MQQGSARPFAVTYMTVHGLRHIDHGEPSSCRLRLMPGSDTAPDALNVMPSERAMAAASSRWPASSRVMRSDQALYERMTREEAGHLEEAAAIARSLGMTFSASGAVSEPGMSLKRHDDGSPWSMCRRPWTVMYVTANGRALPCCIAPFSQRGYENYTLGDASQQTLREIWNGPAYRSFRDALLSDKPPVACASCGLRWSL